MDFVTILSEQFHLKNWQVEKVIELIDEGNTIPFIARYRKEPTVPWTTRRCAKLRSAWNTCAGWRNAAGGGGLIDAAAA